MRTPAVEPWLEAGHLGGLPRHGDQLRRLVAAAVSGVEPPIRAASLVLPDAWLRLAFSESPELPRALKAREEIVRFKLKRLVPFRVEDLRIDAVEVDPFPGQDEPRRLLLGFATELLVAAIEDAFAEEGVVLGRITNRSMALTAALAALFPRNGLAALVAADDSGFSLTLLHGGEPLLQRRKENTELGAAIERELRLTRTFLDERFPGESVTRCFLSVGVSRLQSWQRMLREAFAVEAEPLTTGLLPVTGPVGGVDWDRTAPLLGAARLEVV